MKNLLLGGLMALILGAAVSAPAQQTVRAVSTKCCRPSRVEHFWQSELPAFHDGSSYNLYIPLTDTVTTSSGTPGFIIEDGKNLVVTDVFFTTTNGAPWTPNLVRASQQTGGYDLVLQGTTAEKGWMAGGRGGRTVVPDQQQGVGLALRPGFGSSLEPWEGTVSISGYWIAQ